MRKWFHFLTFSTLSFSLKKQEIGEPLLWNVGVEKEVKGKVRFNVWSVPYLTDVVSILFLHCFLGSVLENERCGKAI